MNPGRIVVDLEALDGFVRYLDAADDAFAAHALDLERRISELQATWHGTAADAHAQAHHAWTTGLQTIQEALQDLRATVSTALRPADA